MVTRPRLEAAAALLIGVLASVAYLATGTPEARQVWHYVTSGAALMACAVWLAIVVRSPLARVGLCWLAWEQMQVAVCGIGSYGLTVPMGISGLCVARYGVAPYLVTVALAILYLWSTGRGRRPNR